MDQTIQSNLCKGLRACGIPKKQSLQILNEVSKWLDCSGTEWTNQRIKDLRQWYETCLAGKPEPPEWFKHSKTGYPLGIWSWVFKLPPGKALGVLSMNTVFYESRLSAAQKRKFLEALQGSRVSRSYEFEHTKWFVLQPGGWKRFRGRSHLSSIQFPTLFDMVGSVPGLGGRSVRPNGNLGLALKAIQESWRTVPEHTLLFLDRLGMRTYIPDYAQLKMNYDEHGNWCPTEHIRKDAFEPENVVGRVSVLQQPQLKARIVGNPNRVLQCTLEPLKELYMSSARKLPTDCTFSQERGIGWVQEKLRQGIELAGSDLTSASDLLQISGSLQLVDRFFGFSEIEGYKLHEEYYRKICASPWLCLELANQGDKPFVQWKQGSVLGTGPSFGLLTLTNNCIGALAVLRYNEHLPESEKLTLEDSFRVIGDDIIMRSEIEPFYVDFINSLGGKVNKSKTLISNRVAEFAGRIITPDSVYLKAIKYNEPSDNSFMSYMAQLGDQAKFFLKSKQRKVYDFFKFIPGVVVDGPWIPDSYGVSLRDRYQWYLEQVEPVLRTADPDLETVDYDQMLLRAWYDLIAQERTRSEWSEWDTPHRNEGYLPSTVTPSFKSSQDPRLTNGKTLVDSLYEKIRKGEIMSFDEWQRIRMEREDVTEETLGSTPSFPLGDSPERDDSLVQSKDSQDQSEDTPLSTNDEVDSQPSNKTHSLAFWRARAEAQVTRTRSDHPRVSGHHHEDLDR